MTGHVTKPGVDWATIRREYEAGTASVRELGRKHFISHTAINKRLKREGWAEPGTVSIRSVETTMPSNPDPQTVEGKKAEIVSALGRGMTPRLAAMLVGVRGETFEAWTKADRDFGHDVIAAQARWADRRLDDINKASERGDWRAGQFAIERHPITAPEFGSNKAGEGAKIEIVFQGMPSPKAVTVDDTGTRAVIEND